MFPKCAVVFSSQPSSCGINVLAEALDGGCEAFGTALQLSNCIKEPVSGLGLLLYICRSNSKCGETNMSGTNKTQQKQARETNV